MGELFQEYCTAALAAAATAGGATFIPESEVRGPQGQSKPDALLLEDRSLIVIEMTVSTLPMAVQVKGNVEEFRQLLAPEGPIGRKLRQPVTAATNLLDGTTHTPRLDPSHVDAIFPVVLFLHPLPQHAMVAREIAAAYTPPAALSTAGRSIPVHAVQFLSAEELEILEPMIAQGTHLADLITGKLASDPFLARVSDDHEAGWSFPLVIYGAGGVFRVLPMSAPGGVAGEAEDVGELVLDRGGLGEHAVGSGLAAAAVVEQDGLADAGEFGE